MKRLIRALILFIVFFLFNIKLNAISDISINSNLLIPNFDKSIHNYNVYVTEDTQIVTINVNSLDNEIVTGMGSVSLKKGLNEFEIASFIDNEEIERYYLNITRGEYNANPSNSQLSVLNIKNLDLDFKSDKYVYECNVDDTFNKLEITYDSVNPLAKIEMAGDILLSKDNNTIKIEVTSEDKKSFSEYIININKKLQSKTANNTKSSLIDHELSTYELKLIKLTIILFEIVIISVLFYFILIKKRTNNILYIKHNILHK